MSDNPMEPGPGQGQPPPPPPPQAPGQGPVPPPQQAYTGPPQQYVVPRNNGLAITSMILGILWICWLGSILAVIFGHVALSQIKKSNGAQGGRGFAIAGLILGYLALALLLLSILTGNAEWNYNVG